MTGVKRFLAGKLAKLFQNKRCISKSVELDPESVKTNQPLKSVEEMKSSTDKPTYTNLNNNTVNNNLWVLPSAPPALLEQLRNVSPPCPVMSPQSYRHHKECNISMEVLQEEKNRKAELLQQAKACLKKQEQKRVSMLEQQVQMLAQNSKLEKLERQTLQHQLHKALKKLHKARNHITQLESKQQREVCLSENKIDIFERPMFLKQSRSKRSEILEENVLECPICGVLCPVSRHRELLDHLDYCFT